MGHEEHEEHEEGEEREKPPVHALTRPAFTTLTKPESK